MNTSVLSVLCAVFLMAACSRMAPAPKETPFHPTENGFGVVAQWIGIDVGPAAQLYYKGTNDIPVMVWPFIGTRGYRILYSNDIALLLCDKPNNKGEFDKGVLIAAQGVGPAMDISKDVLKIAAEQNHVDFARALKVCEPLRLNQTNDAINVLFYSKKYVDPSIADMNAEISWGQIFAIMRDVRTSGKTNKVVYTEFIHRKALNTDVPYLEKDYRR
jgi:hypothetical protein